MEKHSLLYEKIPVLYLRALDAGGEDGRVEGGQGCFLLDDGGLRGLGEGLDGPAAGQHSVIVVLIHLDVDRGH